MKIILNIESQFAGFTMVPSIAPRQTIHQLYPFLEEMGDWNDKLKKRSIDSSISSQFSTRLEKVHFRRDNSKEDIRAAHEAVVSFSSPIEGH